MRGRARRSKSCAASSSTAHPFVTERGGGLFLPDGYFSLHLEGAERTGRYFCRRFGSDRAAACAALEEIAAEAGAEVEGFAQMSPREIARNTGLSSRDAELAAQREFSERFFFAGDAEASAERFAAIARVRGWQLTPPEAHGDPFWEISKGNDAGRAVKSLMNLYRKSLRLRLTSIGIGNSAAHLPLLAAVDHAILLPRRGKEYDPDVQARLSHLRLGEAAGAAGWNQAVLDFLAEHYAAGKSGR